MEKYGFVYIWRDRKRNMYYIGCHWGTEVDGYICSSDRMVHAYKRRSYDFKRRILKTNIPRESLLEEEFKWLSLIPDDQLGKKYYNQHKFHFGHWANNPNSKLTVGEKISKKTKGVPKPNVSEALTGRKLTASQLEKLTERMKGPDNPFRGKHHSAEWKKEHSAKIKGRKHSEEQRQKISAGLKGRKYSPEEKLAHSQATKHYYQSRNINVVTPAGTFKTMSEAAIYNGVSVATISRRVNDKNNTEFTKEIT